MRQNYYLKENLLLNPVIYDRASLNLHSQNTIFKEIFRAKFNALIDNNIKYVLVHKDYINVFNWLPISFKKYSDYFDTIWVKLLDNEYYNLYELSDVRERIYTDSDNLEFEQISSVKYKIWIKNLEDKETLHFLNNFNSNWKIYDPNWITNIPYSYKNISLLTRDTFFGDSQEVHNKYANKWLIDKNTVINNFSKNSYVNNFDWSIDVDLILFYKPQIYYYIGKIITFLTLLLMSFSLIIHFILKRNAK